MAKMFPECVNDYKEYSHEEEAFQALKALPEEYYVFHSFRIHRFTEDDKFIRRECDFIILHPEYGILCLECKYGNDVVKPENKHHTGYKQAFKQVSSFKDELVNNLNKHKINKYIVSYAVCFLSKSKEEFENEIDPKYKAFLENDEYRLIIFSEVLKDAKKLDDKIKEIMSAIPIDAKTSEPLEKFNVKQQENEDVINFLEWKFSLYSSFNNAGLNIEQLTILDLMEYQHIMAIYGFAGTGKSVLAIQKARMEAADNRKVLYICATPLMAQRLQEILDAKKIVGSVKKNIWLYDVDKLREEWKVDENNFEEKIKEGIEGLLLNKKNDLKNFTVIVDEGQDFGTPEREYLITGIFNYINNGTVVNYLDETSTFPFNWMGSFYIFFDQYQLFKGNELPKLINNIYCRVPLIRNCRNTKSIAITAFSPIWGEDDKILYGPSPEEGDKVKVQFCDSDEKVIKRMDENLKSVNQKSKAKVETVILTAMDKIEESVLYSERRKQLINKGNIWYYKIDGEKDCMFTTVNNYKGLECDYVILIDFIPNNLIVGNQHACSRMFYTAITRAKKWVEIIVKNNDCKELTYENIKGSILPDKFLNRAKDNTEKRNYEVPRMNFVGAIVADPVWD